MKNKQSHKNKTSDNERALKSMLNNLSFSFLWQLQANGKANGHVVQPIVFGALFLQSQISINNLVL